METASSFARMYPTASNCSLDLSEIILVFSYDGMIKNFCEPSF
jgi:hypothetical protein